MGPYSLMVITMCRVFSFLVSAVKSSSFAGESVFVYLDENGFKSVLISNLKALVASTKKAPTLFTLWNFYLKLKPVSHTFLSLVFSHVLSLTIDPADKEFYMEAFDVMFRTLHIFPRESDDILSTKISAFMRAFCVFKDGCLFHFEILKDFFLCIDNCDVNYPKIYRIMSQQSNEFLNIFGKLCKLYPDQDIFVIIPTRLHLLISNLSCFGEPLLYGLSGGLRLKKLSLKMLDLSLDNLLPKYVEEHIDNFLYEIISRVLNCTQEPELYEQATGILEKLKDGNRKYLKEYKTCCNNQPSESMTFIRPICRDDYVFRIDALLDSAIQLLRGKYVYGYFVDSDVVKIDVVSFKDVRPRHVNDEMVLKNAFVLIHGFIYSSLGWESSELENILNKTSMHLMEIAEKGFYVDGSDCGLTTIDSVRFSHALRIKSVSVNKIVLIKQRLYDSVIALFSCADLPFGESAYDLLKLIYLEVCVYKVVERYKLKGIKSKGHFDYSLFIDALIECFGMSEKTSKWSSSLLIYMYSRMMEICGTRDMIARTYFFQDIMSKFISLCYFRDLRRRRAGIGGLMALLKNIDIGAKCLVKHRCSIFNALFFYTGNGHNPDMGAVRDILFFILRKTFSLHNHDFQKENACTDWEGEEEAGGMKNISGTGDVEQKIKSLKDMWYGFKTKVPDLVYQLVLGLRDISPETKQLSQACLEYLAELRGSDVTELIAPYKNVILRKIIFHTVFQKDAAVMITLLDSVTYILSLRPPLLDMDVNLYQLADLIIKAFDKDFLWIRELVGEDPRLMCAISSFCLPC
jgi:transformation/transcription domain-associated protein